MSGEARSFAGHVALVTGATSGIGRAICLELAESGAIVHVVGRERGRLDATASAILAAGGQAEAHAVDLLDAAAVARLAAEVTARSAKLDLLIHSAGVVTLDTVEQTRTEDLDLNWGVNLRAPFLLTRDLLGAVRAARGQVVFINSGAGLNASPTWGAYAAAKHGLKALADSLRAEVRADGVRVLSVYPGRTASPMQEKVKAREAAQYDPAALIQPADVSRMVCGALELPRTAHVVDINIRGG